MGPNDLNFLSGVGKPITVAIVGPESAGKTTILGAFYQLLWQNKLTTNAHRFSNSYTLNGWEAVASALRWKPGIPPSFPPHTPSSEARAPGMLHLGFRLENGSLRDFIFADAPGEWFQKWAIDERAADAQGATWIARHADITLLIADREALSGPKLGTARNDFQLLAQRTITNAHGRSIALVWTKGDLSVKPVLETKIRSMVASVSPAVPEFTVSVHGAEEGAADGFRQLFAWILAATRPGIILPATDGPMHDPLFRIGRR
ncbi:hypothetical protein GJV26_20315 [Massilia dura]|uniref:Double-GTPase 2 domain-containing protein n=1 Tax=Pseudoduganella dura TaxID=321982 RepID=A0A6I3XEA1_9BURK|nr:hypothetical protein [Pseudoduganella dura]MUI14789.1 hypothetical protein [Pseudoduganella dura]